MACRNEAAARQRRALAHIEKTLAADDRLRRSVMERSVHANPAALERSW
jgi:hypothetical protein